MENPDSIEDTVRDEEGVLKCKDCPTMIQPRTGTSGRQPERCPTCKDKHYKKYMRDYSRYKRFKNRKHIKERIKREKESAWDLENIPDIDNAFSMDQYDSGTGIDQGSSEE